MTQLHKLSPVSATIGLIQQFPALRGFWPMSGQNYTGSVLNYADYSGNGYALISASHTRTQAALYEGNQHFVPYVEFPGTTNGFLYYPDNSQFDILGTEGWVHSAQRGLTIGCWFMSSVSPGTSGAGLITKYYTPTNNRSYMLYYAGVTGRPVRALVSGDGIVSKVVAAADSDLVLNQWNFAVARYVPSTIMEIFYNGSWTQNTDSVPASIFNSTTRLEIAAYQLGAYRVTGGTSMAFVCAAAVHELMIEKLWETSREMFGR